MVRRATFAWYLVLLGGCGLVLDAAPPRGDAGLDARPMDAPVEPRPDVYVEPGVDAALDVFEPPLPDADFDAGTPLDAAADDAGLPDPCGAAVDGEGCGDGPRRICVGGRCVIAGCGDGFVEADEACEPGGDPACNPFTCQWQCNDALQCETGTPCLVGACVAHACVYEARSGMCSLSGTMGVGVCRGGACELESCGNGFVEGDEECDTRTGVAGCVGCRFACHENSECDDGDPCNGSESCGEVVDGLGMRVGQMCQRGVAIACDTSDPCAVTRCLPVDDSASCVEQLIDADGDGFGPAAGCGADCDDTDPLRNPGAPEICNGIDDDCDGAEDETMASRRWCRDADGDGFGDDAVHLDACSRPAGFVADCTDCFDAEGALGATARLVNPAQLAFFPTPYVDGSGSTSFDYDCSGDEEEEFRESVSCNALLMFECNTTRGWQGSAPGCGEPGSFATCRGIGPLLCSADVATRVQRCR